MSGGYEMLLNRAIPVLMAVEFKTVRRDVVDYAVVLLVDVDGKIETVRVYDGAHGQNELHRYTRSGGKQPAEVVHDGTLGEGMRAAIMQEPRRRRTAAVQRIPAGGRRGARQGRLIALAIRELDIVPLREEWERLLGETRIAAAG